MDSLRSLLVHVDAGPYAEARVRLACRVARTWEASVTSCYAVLPVLVELPVEIPAPASAVRLAAETDDQRRRAALALVERLRSETGAPLPWERVEGDEPAKAFGRRGLYADLLVLGQHDPRTPAPGVPADFVESVLIGSGVPALVLPYIDRFQALATEVLIAWKETRASACAVRAALPLLRRAKTVHVATWLAQAGAQDGAEALLGFLEQHGIRARLHRSVAADAEVGDRMLSLAADLSADLLVMGCYGHSRVREVVLGGASRTVLESMTLPVLMAH